MELAYQLTKTEYKKAAISMKFKIKRYNNLTFYATECMTLNNTDDLKKNENKS